MKKIILTLVGLFVIFSFITVIGSYFVYPSSLGKAEVYNVNIPFRGSDSIIVKIKKEYPQFGNYIYYQDGDSMVIEDKSGFQNFSLQEIGYTVSCKVYEEDDNQIRVLLIYARKNEYNQEFKKINTTDLSEENNKKIKKEFEKQILNKLGEWKHREIFSFSTFEE